MHQTLALVFNPVAGRGEFTSNLFEVVDRLTRGGFLVTAYPTAAAHDAYNFVRRHARDCDYLLCAGGDGTFNEVLDAVMQCGSRPVLGCIPAGSTNDFAVSLGLPRDILHAVDVVINGKRQFIDVGLFGKDHFAYAAAFGLFTDVSYTTPQGMKNLLGHAAYMLESVRRLASIQTYSCQIWLDGEKVEGDFILGMVTNSRSVGGFRFPDSLPIVLDDGQFEVMLVRRPRRFAHLQEIVSALLGVVSSFDGILIRHASSVRIVSETPLQWTLDGEYGGNTNDIVLQNLPRALQVMAPLSDPLVL